MDAFVTLKIKPMELDLMREALGERLTTLKETKQLKSVGWGASPAEKVKLRAQIDEKILRIETMLKGLE